jgi:3-oxoacyl-[acyl-carrier protein] reductase
MGEFEGRTAVIYGAGGEIGGAVAGARVYLAGRTLERLDAVAERIRAEGGAAETASVDALDERAVDAHADAVVAESGRLDVSFNLISHGDVQGTPLADMTYEDFERPVGTALRTNFLTSRAAARHMTGQGYGTILMFGGYGDPKPRLGGLQVAFGALESLRRALACELGPYGVRVVTLQTGGIADTLPQDEPWAREVAGEIAQQTMLGRGATLRDVGDVAVFAASDRARAITATAINITCGSVVD